MKKNFIFLCFCGLLFFSCGSNSADGNSTDSTENAENTNSESSNNSTNTGVVGQLENLSKAIEQTVKDNNGEAVKPVNFRALKEFLPDKIAGIPRTNASGETSSMLGFSISKAEGTYNFEKNKGKGRITMEITDAAGTQMVLMGLAAWAMVTIDKEDDNGYERTMEYKGGKAHQKYDGKRQRGEFTTFVGDRYLVKIEGREVEMDEIIKAMDNINFDKLKNLKSDD